MIVYDVGLTYIGYVHVSYLLYALSYKI